MPPTSPSAARQVAGDATRGTDPHGAQELTYEEEAELCDVPLGTVKSRVARASAARARMMEGDHENEIAA